MGMRELRKQRGLTLEQVGSASGLSANRVVDYNRGMYDVRDMRVRTALCLMKALGTEDIHDLLPDS